MDGGDAHSCDLNRSLDSASSELDALRLDSREGTPSDRGLARSKKLEDAILSEIKKTIALGSNTLDLSNRSLLQIPDEILKMPTLEYLYLEGNELSFLPDEFFDCLPNLKWLDLRRNNLSRIPSVYLGRHRNLRNLLLEENNIKSLPLELGLVKSVSGLNINNNPLEFPPVEILEKGSQEILKFLYEMLQAKLASKSNGDFDEDIPTYDDFDSDQSDEEWLDDYRQGRTDLRSRESGLRETRQSELGGPVPQSAELHHQISYSDRKLQHNEKLKQAGALGTVDASFARRKLLTQQKRTANLIKKQTASATSINSKKRSAKESKLNWRLNQYPEPPSHDFVDIKMAEERKMAKVKELKERQDAILQRRRNEQVLKDWRDDSKTLQQKKYIQAIQNGGLDYDEPAKKAPFAVEKNLMKVLSKEEQIKSEAHEKTKRPMSPGTKQRIEAEKTARIRELEKRIKEHSNNMLQRRKQPKGTPQHEMDAAKKELEIVKQLQKDLMRRYQELKTWTSGVLFYYFPHLIPCFPNNIY